MLTRKGIAIRDRSGKAVERPVTRSLASALLVDKGNHRHFMAKEIHEQPEVIGHTLAAYVDLASEPRRHPGAAVRLRQSHPALHLGLRHRILCLPGRQILVRALGEAAGRCRYRLRVPLPRERRSTPAARRCSSRSRARPPTRWRRCAIAARKASTSCPSSMCANLRSRGSPTRCCRRSPAPRSASPRPRPSPASSRCSRASPSPPARRAG